MEPSHTREAQTRGDALGDGESDYLMVMLAWEAADVATLVRERTPLVTDREKMQSRAPTLRHKLATALGALGAMGAIAFMTWGVRRYRTAR